MQTFTFTLSGTEYWIEEFAAGFAWDNSRDEGNDHCAFYPTQAGAVKAAEAWESERADRNYYASPDANYSDDLSPWNLNPMPYGSYV